MTIIDLTHRIEAGMPVFPGTPEPEISKPFTVEQHGFAETMLSLMSHTGTHMDAPAHMLPAGATLDQLPPKRFIGKGFCIDVSDTHTITKAFLEPYKHAIAQVQFVLLSTKWDQYWGTPQYFNSFQVLSEEGATWLLQFNLSGLGTDCISFDRYDSISYPVHHILLGNGLVLIENMKSISTLAGTFFDLVCAPLHFCNSDGAPVRAFASTQ